MELKDVVTLFVSLLLGATTEAAPIFTQDFEGGVNSGFVDGTSDYASLTRYLESDESGNGHHVRFDFTVPTDPVEGASWSGGLFVDLGNFSSLPPVWQLSFKIATDASAPEPIRLIFSHYTKPKPDRLGPLGEGVDLTFWVTPKGTGWQHVIVNNSDIEFIRSAFKSPRISAEPNTSLFITTHSRGPNGEALSLAEAGNHYLMLDDIDFRVPVVPFVSLQPRSDGKLSLFYTGILQESVNLDNWSTILSQPLSHSIIEMTGSSRFFRASKD